MEHEEDGDWNCDHCSFQGNSEHALKKHLESSKHNVEITDSLNDDFKCEECEVTFKNKRILNRHIRESHKSFKPCNKYIEDRCEFDQDCMYNHIKLKEKESICYKCGKLTNSHNEFVNHIRSSHGNIQCSKHKLGLCKFTSDICFYSHKKTKTHLNNKPIQTQQVFRHTLENLAPPDLMKTNLQQIKELIQVEIRQMIPMIIQQLHPKNLNGSL